jgi:hypothetical protein
MTGSAVDDSPVGLGGPAVQRRGHSGQLLGHRVEQVRRRSAETVQFPYDQAVVGLDDGERPPDSDRPKSWGPLPEAESAKLQEDFWAGGDGA